jgi:NADH:ubiquinone oxidoreductase subunit 2 (subunit N)
MGWLTPEVLLISLIGILVVTEVTYFGEARRWVVEICAFGLLIGALRIVGSFQGNLFALFFEGVFLVMAAVASLAASRIPADQKVQHLVALLLVALGGCGVAAGENLLLLVIGLFTASIGGVLFGLEPIFSGIRGDQRRILRAAAEGHHFHLALAIAFLLLASAIIHAGFGSLNLDKIGALVRSGKALPPGHFWAVFCLLVAGASVGLRSLPLNFWFGRSNSEAEPAVFPAVFVMIPLLSFLFLVRVLARLTEFPDHPEHFQFAIGVLSVATMMSGALAAVFRKKVSEILTQWTVAQIGIILASLLVFDSRSFSAACLIFFQQFLGVVGLSMCCM